MVLVNDLTKLTVEDLWREVKDEKDLSQDFHTTLDATGVAVLAPPARVYRSASVLPIRIPFAQ